MRSLLDIPVCVPLFMLFCFLKPIIIIVGGRGEEVCMRTVLHKFSSSVL